MPRLRQRQVADRWAGALIAVLLTFASAWWAVARADSRAALGERLQLEIVINGQKTDLVVGVARTADGGFAISRADLRNIYLKVPGQGADGDLVPLSSIPGLEVAYDEGAQRLDLKLADTQRTARAHDLGHRRAFVPAARADYGVALNYALFGSLTQDASSWSDLGTPAFSGANASLDARLITPHGVLSQTGLVGNTPLTGNEALRHETTFTRVDPETYKTYRAGDVTSGGVAWSRPIRMAGLQAQHNFMFRPDLVTQALPQFSGSAAVPSTVDVYVNNVRMASQAVGSGPFELTNVPVTGAGEARIVVRDASGRETQQVMSFYNSARNLRSGLYEYSLEIGAPRLRYGVESNDYAEALVGVGTLRMGFTDWLTGEAHAEGGAGLVNGGLGIVARVGSAGVVNLAVSGGQAGGRGGIQTFAGGETRIGRVGLYARTQRSISDYEDLATVTARLRPTYAPTNSLTSALIGYYGFKFSARPARATDSVTVSVPIDLDRSTLNATYLHVTPDEGRPSRIVSLSYSRPLLAGASLFANAFKDLEDNRSLGVFAGVSIPLNGGLSTSAGLASTKEGLTGSASLTKPLGLEPGDWGFRASDSEGALTRRSADVAYRAAAARVEAGVRQEGDLLRATAQAEGSVVAMGGKVFLANRVDDAFGVVDAKVPGVRVMQDNRLVGHTDGSGQLLVPSLRAYGENKLEIDPTSLPVDSEIEMTSTKVTPAYRSGVKVDFGVKTNVANALVTFKLASGADVPTGSEIVLEGGGEAAIVGYEGQAFLKGLKPRNSVAIKLADGTCHATFDYKPVPGGQAQIGPVLCRTGGADTARPADVAAPANAGVAQPAPTANNAADVSGLLRRSLHAEAASAPGPKPPSGSIVVLVDAEGRFLPVGSRGAVLGSRAPVVVGFDGRTDLGKRSGRQTVRIVLEDDVCEATFQLAPSPASGATGPVVCR